MTLLLRTRLARSAKDAAVAQPGLELAPDTSKLKKHITIMVDRLGKMDSSK